MWRNSTNLKLTIRYQTILFYEKEKHSSTIILNDKYNNVGTVIR